MVDYDAAFYDTLNDAGAASARAVLRIAAEFVKPSSAVDVGCGTGIWTAELERLGVSDVLGIDGDYVPRDQLRVAAERFEPVDLSATIDLGRRFDLAVCVEVAEHLDPARAEGFVADLCRLAPAVLFSAATPRQGGTHHVNEQWPGYWIGKFAAHGYRCWDLIRPRVRYDQSVAWIYRQNVMLFLGPDAAIPSGCEQIRVPEPGDVSFEYVARYLVEREDSARLAVSRALRRRLRR